MVYLDDLEECYHSGFINSVPFHNISSTNQYFQLGIDIDNFLASFEVWKLCQQKYINIDRKLVWFEFKADLYRGS